MTRWPANCRLVNAGATAGRIRDAAAPSWPVIPARPSPPIEASTARRLVRASEPDTLTIHPLIRSLLRRGRPGSITYAASPLLSIDPGEIKLNHPQFAT